MSTPKGQRLSTRFTAASEVTPAAAYTPLPKTSDNGRTASGQCSLPTALSQDLPKPTAPGPDGGSLTSEAQLDVLAAEHPEQVVQEKPQAAAPALGNEDLRLAELHAHIIAGELCYSHAFSRLPWQYHVLLFLHSDEQFFCSALTSKQCTVVL